MCFVIHRSTRTQAFPLADNEWWWRHARLGTRLDLLHEPHLGANFRYPTCIATTRDWQYNVNSIQVFWNCFKLDFKKTFSYIGETSRCTYARGKEHIKDMDSKNDRSVLWMHAREKHDGVIPDFTCRVTGVYQRDSLLRQVSEAVMINKEQPKMNTKEEWNFVNIPRAKIT